MLATLRNRNFALLWFGGLISMAGDWMLFIALPLYVYQLTNSTLATSLMFMASTLPRILLGSVAGVFVDRWERRRTMVITNLLLALSILPLFFVRSVETLWIVYVVSFVQSSLGQFFGPAENAFLPTLVGEEHLLTANSLNSLNNDLARLTGPVMGGFAGGLVGLSGIALIDAATYVIAAVLIALITVTSQPEREKVAHASAKASWLAVWQEWLAGLRIITHHRILATLLVMVAISSVGEGIFSVLFVIFVNEVLGGGALEFGWIMSGQAVGGLTGGVVIAALGSRLRVRPARLLGWSAIIFGLIDLLIFNLPVYIPSLALVIGLIALVGLPGAAFGTSFMTLLQTSVSDEFRGRLFGTINTSSALLRFAGMVLAGTLGNVVGIVPVLNIQGFGYVVVGFMALFFLRSVRLPARASELAITE
jgi:MFS family permease